MQKRARSTGLVPPRTPPPVLGRRHVELQTETYLEELTDVIPEAEAGTQTDELPARPPSPTFVPAKVGVDTTTQMRKATSLTLT
ncbi:hypothetical protein WJX84_011499, partial [Apatococcus fuscideae]